MWLLNQIQWDYARAGTQSDVRGFLGKTHRHYQGNRVAVKFLKVEEGHHDWHHSKIILTSYQKHGILASRFLQVLEHNSLNNSLYLVATDSVVFSSFFELSGKRLHLEYWTLKLQLLNTTQNPPVGSQKYYGKPLSKKCIP